MAQPPRRPELTAQAYIQGVRACDRPVLARAITLVESNAPRHLELAQTVLQALLPATGHALRVGITGVPGVGKSSFIERLGMALCDRGHRVAVLAVDPSSSRTRGSILGDKTRMDHLGRHPNAFIRPSPSQGALGGVARKSRETLLLCEAAGFDVVLVETVGVGQSEITVRAMVDFFLLLLLTGAGDELQGMKKGIVELADGILVTKADGDNAIRAKALAAEYNRVLPYLTPATAGWQTRALAGSAHTAARIDALWQCITDFRATTEASGVWQHRRRQQTLEWMESLIQDFLLQSFHQHPEVAAQRGTVEAAVLAGRLPPTAGVQRLIACYRGEGEGKRGG
ncbi:MAG: methylmalonyl Co-A mutase-associated GTPase MeaB [Candidatus Competibacterales bacterium]